MNGDPSSPRLRFGIYAVSALLTIYTFGSSAGVLSHSLGPEVVAWALPLFVVGWAFTDAAKSGFWPAFHFGWWLYACWPVVLPYYVFRTRGRSGWRLFAGLYLALLAPYLGGLLGLAVWEHVPESLWAE